ncbi:hypothetical protein [Chromobacterium amazonense]|uniref:hypothetical protein n=1 Tax=Chromobacterium amazonense TaxID=1382803 RepID=UPI000583DEB1|nr:hypothetical protein [Chromobacterium amazonense]KIA81238.1 hypothetical protein QR66_05695 [Chromobacterium piscinae]MBM2882923.1 hypothetical protein [Chromobacterium amazonense]MDE1713029.1 hypothetical protein [Chromobacterium amazonense]
MKLHLPHPHLHFDGEQWQQGAERWADITLQGWLLFLDSQARRQAWLSWREHRLAARVVLIAFACWLSGSLVLLGLVYLLYLLSTRW